MSEVVLLRPNTDRLQQVLLRELKKGETFASLLNIHDGYIRVFGQYLVEVGQPLT
jgi:hypothetical protein